MKHTKKLFFISLFFLLQPIFLPAQSDDIFSVMDKIFRQAKKTTTPQDEYFLGRAVAANILSIYKPYSSNKELSNYLNLICQTLVINSSGLANDTIIFNGYHVMILDSPEFNAFATPGGHIFISKGLVEAAACEDALAGIIAHELAHIMLRHGMKMVDEMSLSDHLEDMASSAAAFSGKTNSSIVIMREMVNDYFNNMLKNGYSSEQEFEADACAVELLALSGYFPRRLLEMLETIKKIQNSRKGGFNDTHPSPQERIEYLKNFLRNYKFKDTSQKRQNRFSRITGKK